MTVQNMSEDEIFEEVRTTLVDMFELDPGAITMDAGVFEELDLDSIDAIDLVAKLQEMTGRRVTEEEMRQVRKVRDIVGIVQGVPPAGAAEAPGSDDADTPSAEATGADESAGAQA